MQLHELASWCRLWLGAEPAQVLFETRHVSTVVGLQFADGREIVLKARPSAPRLLACAQVQHHLWLAGYPCPQWLVGPAALGSFSVTAEAYAPGGEQLARSADAPRRFAEALADLVAHAPAVDSVPSLAPPPAWVWWDHDQPGIWPLPDDSAADLNADHEPAWLNDVGRRVRQRLAHCHLPPVIGHADWESQNLRWSDGQLHVVHHWDSVVSQPEAMIAGAAAAVFPASGMPLTDATLNETEVFLAAYAHARSHPWSAEEWHVCWAAGLWVRAFNSERRLLALASDFGLSEREVRVKIWDSGFDRDCDLGRYTAGEVYHQTRQCLGLKASYEVFRRMWALAFEPDPALLALLDALNPAMRAGPCRRCSLPSAAALSRCSSPVSWAP